MNSRLFLLLAALLLLLAVPVHAVLFHTASDWQPVDPADPGFTYDRANIAKALYPPSDPNGNQMVFARALTSYVIVPIRRVPGPAGAAQRLEDWAFDCAGKRGIISTTDTDAAGHVTLNTAINAYNGATGAQGEQLGIGLWGPEHFMTPIGNDARIMKVQALACTPERTSLDPAGVTQLVEGRWHHGRLEKKAEGWEDGLIVHGKFGQDEVTAKIDLFAKTTAPSNSILTLPQVGKAQAGVKVGLTVDFSRRLDFFPTGHYPWGYKSVCNLAVTADGLDTGWGYDHSSPIYGKASVTARTPGAAHKLIDRIAAGDYDLTVTCEDYKQPVIFHITRAVPQQLIDDLKGYIEEAGGLEPPPSTQGL